MAKKTLVVSVEYWCRQELKVIWHWRMNPRRSSGLEPLKVSGARMHDWLGGGGVGGVATAMFWPIANSACTSCWTSVGRIMIHYRTHLLSPVQRARKCH